MAPSSADTVITRAAAIARAAADGGAWLAANQAVIRRKDDPVAQAFRKFARRAERLRAAAGRPTCVAVFGASQAGKSYLVSSLATLPGRKLAADYGSTRLDFLRDMNPQGDKEATGLVTRFTRSPITAPPQAPIPVRLLSQTDVVKILANAYLEDFKLDDVQAMDGAALTALFDRLEAEAGPAPQGGIGIDDIEELREYFSLHFRTNPLLQELGSNYWTRAAAIIPRLPPSRRAEAYAPLWNFTDPFTRLAATLIGGLEQLGFPDIAFCGLDALMPREQGVLNADTVFAVAEGGRGLVRVQGARGMATDLDRSLLAALIAELTFPLAEKSWEFLEKTDLLDFPGARSREVIRALSFLDEPGRLGRVFLRGKVAYLYQRYNAEQEIAAMLLCVGPSNQDVQTLPEMIATWINQTIGATPAARAKQRNSLFVVLTKFDTEFIEKAGEDVASGQRWTTRLQASLLDFFGKAYDWPTSWAGGKPFDNCFWLRSTAVRFAAAFDYGEASDDAPAVETLAARAEKFLAPRRTAYLANASVRAHFADPERAWDQAMRENDGGVGYLAEQLKPVCDPTLKTEQIAGRLEELAADIAGQLRPLFHDGDLAAELERTRLRSRAVLRDLLACARAQRFGRLIRALQVTPDQITSLYWRLQSEAADTPVPIGTASSEEDYGDLGDFLDDPGASPQPDAARDRFERLAELAIEDWMRGMQNFADSSELQPIFHIGRENAQILTGEIFRAAVRLKLRARATQALHAHASFQNRSATAAQKPVIILEQIINDFVHMLGFAEMPAEQRPATPNGSRLIFAPRPAVTGLPQIGAQPTPYDSRFHVDWMTALARTMEDNVQDVSSGRIDIEQNARLGTVLKQLEPQT